MISALGAASGLHIDSEYLRIIQELRKLGITPTGDKSIDSQRLNQAKQALIEKIQSKENNNEQNIGVQTISPVDEAENSKRAEMEEQRLGAMTVAELNRLYFKI